MMVTNGLLKYIELGVKMRDELDAKLVAKYPTIFKNRFASMQETCMCWGFECGDGWYDILDSLCGQIDNHVKWKRKQRAYDLKRARATKKGRDTLIKFLSGGHRQPSEWEIERADEILQNGDKEVTPYVAHVVAQQVKEKFGGLRFYYHGGDDEVSGMVRMAESWAARTCETCGERGTLRHGGWIRTLCDKHEEEYQARQAKYKSEDDDE